MATHKVGGEVDALCTRCKLTLAHTILAMVGTKIARVRCNTCGGDHAYRGAPGVTDRPSSSSTTRTARASSGGSSPSKAEKIIISFEEQLAGKDVASAPRYSPKDTYRVDQVIQHPTFGTGFVTAVRGDKVDITFRGTPRRWCTAAAALRPRSPSSARPSARRPAPPTSRSPSARMPSSRRSRRTKSCSLRETDSAANLQEGHRR
ncbi:hypothetical protein [Myxococcus hansupus]|uniref:hypothetical protein n=1 Tax=Pseudomyxococcus hansupus TaxID=1297742 RepID=UPI001D055AC8|nr:hypothetical protein [Myxococcus hansupus]